MSFFQEQVSNIPMIRAVNIYEKRLGVWVLMFFYELVYDSVSKCQDNIISVLKCLFLHQGNLQPSEITMSTPILQISNMHSQQLETLYNYSLWHLTEHQSHLQVHGNLTCLTDLLCPCPCTSVIQMIKLSCLHVWYYNAKLIWLLC